MEPAISIPGGRRPELPKQPPATLPTPRRALTGQNCLEQLYPGIPCRCVRLSLIGRGGDEGSPQSVRMAKETSQ